MADSKSGGATGEIAEGLKSIFQRVADFFDILDLSFLVSGATAAAAIAFWGWRCHMPLPSLPSGWISTIAVLVLCYVSGLVCFAVGRWLRVGRRRTNAEHSHYQRLVSVLEGHGLTDQAPFREYLERTESRGDWRLYVRMWAELRIAPTLAPSFSLLRRYWVMAATYDGISVALFVWAAVLVLCSFGMGGCVPIDKWLAIPGAGTLVISSFACSHEAGRYVEYQVEELVASIVAKRAADNR